MRIDILDDLNIKVQNRNVDGKGFKVIQKEKADKVVKTRPVPTGPLFTDLIALGLS